MRGGSRARARGDARAEAAEAAHGDGGLPPTRGLLALAGPLVVSFWLRAAFSYVDQLYAAQLDEPAAAIAAIGLSLPFEFVLIACWVGTSNGLTARLGAAMGARQGRRIEQLKAATRRIVWALVALFLLLAAGLWLGAPHVGLEPDVARAFQVYATVLVGGSALTSLWSVLPDSLIKAHHDTKSTMWAGVLSGTSNVLLNTLFVFGFGWGLGGIALSTVLGRLLGLVYAQHRAAVHERARLASGRDDAPGEYERPTRVILVIAVPAAIGYVLMSVESFAVNGILAGFERSTEALAAWAVFDSSTRFLSMPLIALSVAMLPLSARLYGSRDVGGIRRELRTAAVWGSGFVLLVVVPLAVFAGPPVAAYLSARASGEHMREWATLGMYWLPAAVLARAPMFVLRSAFEGMQRPRPGLVASLVRTLALVVPLTWLGTLVAPWLGASAIHGAYAGSTLGAALASWLLAAWLRAALRAEPG